MNSFLPSWYSSALLNRSLRVVTFAEAEQLTLAQAQQHLRLDTYGSPLSHPDDDLIMGIYLPAAREFCETLTGRAFTPQLYEYGLADFPRSCFAPYRLGIPLPIGPVTQVVSVEYTMGDGTIVSLMEGTDYVVDTYYEPAAVYPFYGTVWPQSDRAGDPNNVRVRFYAGYDLDSASPIAARLPRMYKAAMLLMLTHYYENRSQVDAINLKELPMGVSTLLGPDALRKGFA